MPNPCLYHNENINIILFDIYVSYMHLMRVYIGLCAHSTAGTIGLVRDGRGDLD
jgi:hypothetical protein